jgi:rhodanese-related sulfurtransferase
VTLNAALGVAALAAGLLAALGGSATPGSDGSLDVMEVATDIEQERDRISALELARWIRDARPNFRLIDLRSGDDFDAFHIPGAERMSVSEVVRAPWKDETVVLYGSDGTRAAQTRVLLRARGVRDSYYLRGGAMEWARTIAAPTLPANPAPDEAARWREVADMSRWFGGTPRQSDSLLPTPDSLRAAIGRIRRRGC